MGGVYFFRHLSISLVNPRLNTKNKLYIMPGSVLKVCVGGGWEVVVVESEFSDQLWLSFSLAKPNN